ncbi:MAG TPA: hypothetical protein VFX35_13630 [Solirubrobacterales bacterium]|nr:hypothetical protein [Solirubrobacterales bacterium]
MKPTMEQPDIHIQGNPRPGEPSRPVMEHRHWFGNRLRYAAAVVRAERARRRNRQEKLF